MAEYLTAVRLLSAPLEKDNLHTLYFQTKEAQIAYFNSLTRFEMENCTYIRKDRIIRYPKKYDDLIKCNYVMYINDSRKWYYAFITKMEYVNEERTDIYIENDPIQTWFFDYTVKPSFIEREHVARDEVGEHTVPEQLETGDYICGTYNKAGYCDKNDLMIVVGVTQDKDGNQVVGTLYDNIYSGLKYYSFANNDTGIAKLNQFISEYPKGGAAEAIQCMFLAPKELGFREGNIEVVSTNYVDIHYINHDSDDDTTNTTIAFTDNMFGGYIPRNKKLLCYPYRYLYASNNNGGNAIYKYELFYNKEGNGLTMLPPTFTIHGVLSVGCSIRLIPDHYNGVPLNHSEALTLGKFPALNWNSDVFTNWVTQNSVNIGTSIGSAFVSTGMGIAGVMASGVTGGISGAMGVASIVSGVSSIASTLGEVYSHSLQPPQSEGNLNSGDVATASGQNDFHFYDMQIKREMAMIIDGYFDMYGYKVNRVGLPNIMHRAEYSYLKTIDVNLDGNVPADDMQKIKDIYNRGFTFWYNPEHIGDYSVDNYITG